MIPPKRIEEIELFLKVNRHVKLDQQQRYLYSLVSDLEAERKKLVAIADLSSDYLYENSGRTDAQMEYDLDKALKAWKGSDERSK